MKQIKRHSPAVVFLIAFLVFWEIIVRVFSIPEYLIPAPSRILAEIRIESISLLVDLSITMMEAFLGFLIANVLGIIFAVAFVHSRLIENCIYPYAIAFKAIPLVAIAPLLVLWFGSGLMGKVVMASTISFFPILVNATIGLKSIDPEALDLMKSLSASRMQILIKLRLPIALPHIFSALKISSTLSVIGAIVAEMSGATQGIGHAIMVASYGLETPTLFAGIVSSSLGSILFFKAIAFVENKVLTWHDSSQLY